MPPTGMMTVVGYCAGCGTYVVMVRTSGARGPLHRTSVVTSIIKCPRSTSDIVRGFMTRPAESVTSAKLKPDAKRLDHEKSTTSVKMPKMKHNEHALPQPQRFTAHAAAAEKEIREAERVTRLTCK